MNITVNGKPQTVEGNTTVQALLEQLDLGHERIAVEHNHTILQLSEYASVTLKDGDTLEIVRFVGGG